MRIYTSVPASPLIQLKPYEIGIFRCTWKTCTNPYPNLLDCKETIKSMKLAWSVRPTQMRKQFPKTHVLNTSSHLQYTCKTIRYDRKGKIIPLTSYLGRPFHSSFSSKGIYCQFCSYICAVLC